MRKITGPYATVNILGALGYIAALWGWVFLMGAIVYLITQTSLAKLSPLHDMTPSTMTTEMDASSSAIGYVVALVMILVSVAILIALPYFVGKQSSRFMRRIMLFLAIPLTRRRLFLTKSVYSALPLALFIAVELLPGPIDTIVPQFHAAAIVTGLFAIGSFLAQVIVAKKRAVSVKDVW